MILIIAWGLPDPTAGLWDVHHASDAWEIRARRTWTNRLWDMIMRASFVCRHALLGIVKLLLNNIYWAIPTYLVPLSWRSKFLGRYLLWGQKKIDQIIFPFFTCSRRYNSSIHTFTFYHIEIEIMVSMQFRGDYLNVAVICSFFSLNALVNNLNIQL